MWEKYKNFIRGVSVNWVGKVGVILVTATVISFFIFEAAHTAGLIRNAYFGLITYLAFPVLFVLGLVLIPIGWIKYKKSTGRSTSELLSEQFQEEEVAPKQTGSSVFRIIALLTVLNIIIFSAATLRMLHFMDQAEFCGTACHRVMNPEWVTYQQSPHARVPCVECHVGEGLDALIESKLNGIRQMYLAALDMYNQPIPTPVHQLRPAQETCEHCHWPEKFFGQRMTTMINYAFDSLSTPRYTTLNVKIDAGHPGHEPGSHWHIAESNKVRYTSVQDKRREMIRVQSVQADGSYKTFVNQRIEQHESEEQDWRVMDCMDCHNRATHIYADPERAVDQAIRSGKIDKTLPFVKRQALEAVTNNYPSNQAAITGIENEIAVFYKRNYPHITFEKRHAIEETIKTLQDIHTTNIHHEMKIEWGTYPSHRGHHRDLGCFRCHNSNMKAVDDTSTIKHECTMCHSILAMDSDSPLEFLSDPQETDRDAPMHRYLQKEFLKTRY